MKAIMLQVRDFVCENGEFCHAVNQIFLASFGSSVVILSIMPLT